MISSPLSKREKYVGHIVGRSHHAKDLDHAKLVKCYHTSSPTPLPFPSLNTPPELHPDPSMVSPRDTFCGALLTMVVNGLNSV